MSARLAAAAALALWLGGCCCPQERPSERPAEQKIEAAWYELPDDHWHDGDPITKNVFLALLNRSPDPIKISDMTLNGPRQEPTPENAGPAQTQGEAWSIWKNYGDKELRPGEALFIPVRPEPTDRKRAHRPEDPEKCLLPIAVYIYRPDAREPMIVTVSGGLPSSVSLDWTKACPPPSK